MSKKTKLEKNHLKIVIASEQIMILSKFIGFYTENDIENQVLANLINEKSKQILFANEKIAKIFKI